MSAVAERAGEVPTEDAAPGCDARRFHIGVLFVHGIGKPRPSETLIGFGDALARGLDAELPHARLASPPLRHPAHAELLTKRYDEPQPRDIRWLLAEGHWADAIIATTFGALLRWCFGILPHTLLTRFQQASPGPRVEAGPRARARALAKTIGIRVPLTVLTK